MAKYHDPLHVPYADLTVCDASGKERLVLNKRLMDRQNCWENLELIKTLHRERLDLEDEMLKEDDSFLLKLWDAVYTEIEFDLQRAWGFEENQDFHRFWYRPKCTCPKLDNDDRYPTGHYVINMACPLHGSINES